MKHNHFQYGVCCLALIAGLIWVFILPSTALAVNCCREDNMTSTETVITDWFTCNDDPGCMIYCTVTITNYLYDWEWPCTANTVLLKTMSISCGAHSPVGCSCAGWWPGCLGPSEYYDSCGPTPLKGQEGVKVSVG